ncbi:hypothetical protein [Clostridium algidicarnis]|uniref:Putative membrane protein n=1 Tax=Clostridium algidicarnis DSM 15099 TaxID=1121295 RepID=A0A2S6FWE5_9CLOT|nr:hypothetical protein [Clostridium algidicarnis]PPK47913.1 putative membrane protein [Clostridium algidicarnis DSM 15099]
MRKDKLNYMSKTIISLVLVASIVSPNLVQASEAIKKDESVYITLDKEGKVQDKIVSTWIHNPNGGDIKDKSNLKDIKNIKGEDKPEINGESITWRSKENDIFYQGNSNEELPLEITMIYYLNGVSIKPEELAGKSGKVKISLEIKNKEAHKVTINGKEKTIYTPFATVALLNLPMDSFKNININSGQIVSDGNNNIITYIGLPGLKESLGLNTMDIDLGLEDKLEIEADVENFKMGPVMITATPDLPEIEKLKDSKDLSELVDGIDELKDASGKLKEGSEKLSEGESLFAAKMGDLVVGTDKLKGGSTSLKNGAYDLKSGINTAGKGIGSIQGEMSKKENQKKIALITDDNNVKRERTLINDAYFAKDIDISSMGELLPLLSENNMNLMGKTFVDYRAVGISKMLANPMIKELKALSTPENISNIEALINTTDQLSGVDVDTQKLQPLLEVMKNVDKLAPLMGELNSLAPHLSVIDTLAPIFQNASAINNILDSAKALEKVNGVEMEKTLKQQQAMANKFVGDTNELVKEENVNALREAVNKAYPTDNEETEVVNKQLQALISGYNSAVVGARDGFIKSKGSMDGMEESLQTLIALQQALGQNKDALEAISKALNPETMKSINKMTVTLKEIQAKTEDPDTKAMLIELNNVLNDKEVMGELNKVNQMLPAIQGMKSTLDKNKENIEVSKKLLEASKSKEFKETVENIAVLEEDMKNLQPIITAVENNMTPEVMDKISKSPESINTLMAMQKHLKDSEDILSIMRESLEENNVNKVRESLNKLPQLTGGIKQLEEGANKLYQGTSDLNNGIEGLSSGAAQLKDASNQLEKGAKELNEGMTKFDEEGVTKLHDKVSEGVTDIDDVLASKDEIVKLSEDYGTFSGIEEGMEGKVKFIIKTEEIKIPEAKIETKVEVKEEKKGIINWIKNIFSK